jgi:hypothetical protein
MLNQLTCRFPETNTRFTMTLKKTIRLADDEEYIVTPPDRGNFPFYMQGHQRIVPIGSKEVLCFNFLGNQDDVAVKLLLGDMNAITGEEETGEARVTLKNKGPDGARQNYMMVPGQRWLDSFKHNGVVGRFTAQTGSIQIIVIPNKKEILEQEQAEIQKPLAHIRRLCREYPIDDELVDMAETLAQKESSFLS